MRLLFLLVVVVVVVGSGVVPPSAGAAEAAPSECSGLIQGLRERYHGHWNDALEAFRKSILEEGDVAAAWLHLGLTYELKGERDRAREAYTQALRLRPDYACAKYYRDRLDRPDRAASLVGQASDERVDAEVVASNYSRFLGRRIELEGRLMCGPCTRGPNPVLIVSGQPQTAWRTDSSMRSVFVVRLSRPLPDDPRVRVGARVVARGTVVGRDFFEHPSLQVMSAERRPIVKGEFLTISDEASLAGPLNFNFGD